MSNGKDQKKSRKGDGELKQMIYQAELVQDCNMNSEPYAFTPFTLAHSIDSKSIESSLRSMVGLLIGLKVSGHAQSRIFRSLC